VFHDEEVPLSLKLWKDLIQIVQFHLVHPQELPQYFDPAECQKESIVIVIRL
jgi:hypothetical protein